MLSDWVRGPRAGPLLSLITFKVCRLLYMISAVVWKVYSVRYRQGGVFSSGRYRLGQIFSNSLPQLISTGSQFFSSQFFFCEAQQKCYQSPPKTQIWGRSKALAPQPEDLGFWGGSGVASMSRCPVYQCFLWLLPQIIQNSTDNTTNWYKTVWLLLILIKNKATLL